jgi:ankyrin repeat protein
MPRSPESQDYQYMTEVLASGTVNDLEELAGLCEDFPGGRDPLVGRHWITNAIDCGSELAVAWMLSKGVDLSFRDEEGYTVLHSALERASDDKYRVLELLLRHGAPVNARGINDWTPAHMAAVREDIEGLKLLVAYKADLSIRTTIDHYATPLEEARLLKKEAAVRFLERVA